MIFASGERFERYRLFTIGSLFFVLTAVKGIERLIYPAIWAEDGSVFLKQAFEIGWSSLFIPYDGYFHTVPRLIALMSTWLPINGIPFFIVLACYAIFTYTITLLFTKPYKWLFRDQTYIFIVAFLLLLSPGQKEILGNLTNLHWYLLLLLSIIALKDIELQYTFRELIIVFLCVSTEGAVIILLPLFATRLFLRWNKALNQKYGDILIISMICVFTIINLLLSKGSHIAFTFSTYFDVFITQFVNFFIFHIFVGDHLTLDLHNYKTLSLVIAVLIVFLLSFVLRKTWEKSYLLIVILSFCALLLPVMVAMARPMSIITLKTFSYFDPYHWFQFRYSFYVPAIASIFWFFLISRIPDHKIVKSLMITVILLSQVFMNTHRMAIHKYTQPSEWSEKAKILEQSISTGCPNAVTVNINPAGWAVTFKTRVKNSNCSSAVNE